MGKVDSPIDASPKVIPALQHKDVIAVVLGDYHSGALTSAGRLLTWGSFSAGALGLGDPAQLPVGAPGGYDDERHRQRALDRGYGADPPPVEVPTEVRFGRGEKFAFLAAAAGWHMGALVLDLDVRPMHPGCASLHSLN
jgi:SCF-associated factor 1